MSYPSAKEFKALLLSRPLPEILDKHLFSGIPYVFREAPEKCKYLRSLLAQGLGVLPENIHVVGSGKIGFSLSPDNFLTEFSEQRCDIDVVIHDEHLFDKIWRALLSWHYSFPARSLYGRKEREFAAARQKEIYWGWLEPRKLRFPESPPPNSLKPLTEIRTRWFNAFQDLSRYPNFLGLDIKGRLYRTIGHARLYHLGGLKLLKESVLRAQERN